MQLRSLSLVVLSVSRAMAAINNNTLLWYTEPSVLWTDALPIGNGRLGAMIYGDPRTETIQLNEESVWSGGPLSRQNSDAPATITEIRELLSKENIAEAEKLADLGLVSAPQSCRNYEPLADNEIYFDGIGNITNGTYRRWLDIDTAVAGVEFESNDTKYQRELFASYPDDVIVHKINVTDGDAKIALQQRLYRSGGGLNVEFDQSYGKNGNSIYLIGSTGGSSPIVFVAGIRVVTDGTLRTLGDFIVIENATEVISYTTGATTFRVEDPVSEAESILDRAQRYSYDQLRQRHIDDYQNIFRRCTLELDSPDNNGTSLPTNERVNATQDGATDLGLISLQFQYGRYMLISSSRPGNLPANLQGIWNDELSPPWGSKYTININTEMNYWPAEVTNMPETHFPLFDLIEKIRQRGTLVAQRMYNASSGWVVHHNTDLWGDAAPVDRYLPASYWTLAGGWLSTHLLEHYFYTGDHAFILEKLPTIAESIQFYLNTLQPYKINETTYLVTSPSVSPENTFFLPDNETQARLTVGPTCDIQIIRELFTQYLQALALLNAAGYPPPPTASTEFLGSINTTLDQLPPHVIGERYNTIQEWIHDYREAEPGHRHISHLYGLYPGSQITPKGTPELWEAAARTLQHRLDNGGAGTGWSRAWTLNWNARLLNASALENNIFEFFNQSVYPNLFDAHPPFQADGNWGFTAGIAESLLQSHFGKGEIWVLPAVPESWVSGSVNGLVARGGFVVNVTWSNNSLSTLDIESRLGGPLTVRYAQFRDGDTENSTAVVDPAGQYTNYTDGDDGSFSLVTLAGESYQFRFEW